jgi:Glutamine amidotransferase domain
LAVVHNGIIENFSDLLRELEAKGAKFATETDTEVIAHLVTEEMKRGKSPVEAVKAALRRLRGAFALAFLFAGEDNLLIAAPRARRSGEDAMYVGSDAIALAAIHRHGQLSRRRRLGDRHPPRRRGSRHQRQRRRARRHQVASLGHANRQWQSSAFHGQGNA